MKKTWFLILVMSVIIIVFSGCSKSDQSQESGQESGSKNGESVEVTSEASIVTPAGEFPISKEKTELSVFVLNHPKVQEYENNEFTHWFEEQTNIHIDWEAVPSKGAESQLNLMLSSGDYTDVIMGFPITPTQEILYGKQGVFLPLNDLIDKYGVNIKKVFEKDHKIKEIITASDGNIYSLPRFSACYHCSMGYKMWIYKPWLEKLNLDPPQTTEDFYNVLKAFKEQDPNGNGKPDEIPLVGASDGTLRPDIFLMNAFIYTHGERPMILNDGKIDVVFNKPEWQAGLKYMNKLFKEGLLSDVSFTQDQQKLKQLIENPGEPIVGALTAQAMPLVANVNGDRWLQYETIAPLEGPEGVRIAFNGEYEWTHTGNFVITKAAKHPELAIRWADALYTDEMSLNSIFGLKDKGWVESGPNAVGIDGEPAKYKIIAPNEVQNLSWRNVGPSYRTNEFLFDREMDPEQMSEKVLYDETKKNYEQYKQDIEKVVSPHIYFTEAQANELINLEAPILQYVEQMIARFVTGEVDIDKEWDKYVQTLENMNLGRYLEIYQEAHDSKK